MLASGSHEQLQSSQLQTASDFVQARSRAVHASESPGATMSEATMDKSKSPTANESGSSAPLGGSKSNTPPPHLLIVPGSPPAKRKRVSTDEGDPPFRSGQPSFVSSILADFPAGEPSTRPSSSAEASRSLNTSPNVRSSANQRVVTPTEIDTAPLNGVVTGGTESASGHEVGFERALARHQGNRSSRAPVVSVPTPPQPRRHPKVDVDAVWQRMDHTWTQVRQLVTDLSLRRQQQIVQRTMYYMWRFYMGYQGGDTQGRSTPPHSIEDFDRRLMMCACLFFAAKKEDSLFRLGDLVVKAWNHEVGTQEYHQRVRQIAKAELYLIVGVLRFDFTYTLPATIFVETLTKLRSCGPSEILGNTKGEPWCIAAYQIFHHVYRTPLCVIYTPHELAAGLLKLCKKWLGKESKAWDEIEKWEVKLGDARAKLDKVANELEKGLSHSGCGQDHFLKQVQHWTQQKGAERSSQSPPPPARDGSQPPCLPFPIRKTLSILGDATAPAPSPRQQTSVQSSQQNEQQLPAR